MIEGRGEIRSGWRKDGREESCRKVSIVSRGRGHGGERTGVELEADGADGVVPEPVAQDLIVVGRGS